MISDNSSKHFTKKNRVIYNNYKKKPNIHNFLDLIKKGIIPRPHYALGLLLAAKQAFDLGYKKIKVFELGCHNLEGLIDLENYATDIKKFLKIDFEIFGFDLKEGLPKYTPNNFDRLSRWSPGDYSLDIKKNLKYLKFSKILYGDVKKTIPMFINRYKKTFLTSPISFVIYDLDYYTSTKNGLNLLKLQSKNYIPKTYVYFGDYLMSSFDEGERKAVLEFNKTSKYKISDIGELAEQLSIFFKKWIFLGKRLNVINYFNHKKHKSKVDQILF
jgi:hypothetical protein